MYIYVYTCIYIGHYVCFCSVSNHISKSGWVCISDASWKPVDESDVLKAKAYMLFYEKMFPIIDSMLNK